MENANEYKAQLTPAEREQFEFEVEEREAIMTDGLPPSRIVSERAERDVLENWRLMDERD